MQRSNKVGRNTKNTSFIKGFVLLFILIAAYIFHKNMSSNGLPTQFTSMLSGEFENYRNLREVEPSVSDSLKKVFSGFWTHTVGDDNSPVKITDHLEIKDNGIIWQVIRWDVSFLNLDTLRLYHIRHGYVKPFSMSSDTSEVMCDVRTIRQSFIIGNDTCYGASQLDHMWRVNKNSKALYLNKKTYTLFSGSLSEFFPEGAIDLIDDIKVFQCKEGSALTPYAKKFLIDKFNGERGRLLPDTKRVIYEYYDHFLKAELIESLPVMSTIPDSVPVMLTVQPDGNVAKAVIENQIVSQSKLEELILREASTWKFPVRQSFESSDVRYVVHFK